jgi:hypothetical protein
MAVGCGYARILVFCHDHFPTHHLTLSLADVLNPLPAALLVLDGDHRNRCEFKGGDKTESITRRETAICPPIRAVQKQGLSKTTLHMRGRDQSLPSQFLNERVRAKHR